LGPGGCGAAAVFGAGQTPPPGGGRKMPCAEGRYGPVMSSYYTIFRGSLHLFFQLLQLPPAKIPPGAPAALTAAAGAV